MTREQKLLIGGIATFIILCVIAIIGYFIFSPQTEEEPTGAPEYIVYAPLRVENFTSYPDVKPPTQTAIIDSLQRYIDRTESTTPITGVIRNGSYSKIDDGTISRTTFLVDISEVQRTYKVHIGRDASTGENSVYILCPTEKELRYPRFECKDDLNTGGMI